MTLEQLFALAHDLGAARHGVVRADDLRRAGADPDTVAQALARHWQAPVRGIYVPHRRPLSDPELGQVATEHAGPGSIITGILGARVRGFRWLPELDDVVMLVPPHVQHRDSRGLVTVRRAQDHDGVAVTAWEGMLLASDAQLVVDASRQAVTAIRRDWGPRTTDRSRAAYDARCLRAVRGIVLGAVADKRCGPDEIEAVLGRGSVRDTRAIRRACVDARRGVASPPEAEWADEALVHNVPFSCNVELWSGTTLVAVVDGLLLGTGVAAELDSKERHADEQLLDRTLDRHRRADRHDTKLVHVSPTRFRADPPRHFAELFDEVRRRMAVGLGDPRGLTLVLRGPILCGTGAPAYPVPAWAQEAARTGVLPEHLRHAA